MIFFPFLFLILSPSSDARESYWFSRNSISFCTHNGNSISSKDFLYSVKPDTFYTCSIFFTTFQKIFCIELFWIPFYVISYIVLMQWIQFRFSWSETIWISIFEMGFVFDVFSWILLLDWIFYENGNSNENWLLKNYDVNNICLFSLVFTDCIAFCFFSSMNWETEERACEWEFAHCIVINFTYSKYKVTFFYQAYLNFTNSL